MSVGAGHGLDARDDGLAGQVAGQLADVLGEALGGVAVAAQGAAQGVHVGAGGTADAQVDAVRVELGQRAELLGDDIRSVVRQHHPARA